LLSGGGGVGSFGAELYDPVLQTFSTAGSMMTMPRPHNATLLKSGKVLMTGNSAAELYDPPVSLPAPMLFSVSGDGQGQGTILHAGTDQVASESNPAVVGETLEIYCAGLSDGSVIPPQISIGGRMAELLSFGKAPGLSDMNKVNVRVPNGVAAGPAVSVRMTYLGRYSNEVSIAVR
jgi:uncharacterized protein (TIGR03437 family)